MKPSFNEALCGDDMLFQMSIKYEGMPSWPVTLFLMILHIYYNFVIA